MPSFDGIESSLLLADDFWDSFEGSVPGSIVIGMPARDVMIITGSRSPAGIAKVRRAVDRMFFAGGPAPAHAEPAGPPPRRVAIGSELYRGVSSSAGRRRSRWSSSAKTCSRTGLRDSARSCRAPANRTSVTCRPEAAVAHLRHVRRVEHGVGVVRRPRSRSSRGRSRPTSRSGPAPAMSRPACSRACAVRIAASQPARTAKPPSGFHARS